MFKIEVVRCVMGSVVSCSVVCWVKVMRCVVLCAKVVS